MAQFIAMDRAELLDIDAATVKSVAELSKAPGKTSSQQSRSRLMIRGWKRAIAYMERMAPLQALAVDPKTLLLMDRDEPEDWLHRYAHNIGFEGGRANPMLAGLWRKIVARHDSLRALARGDKLISDAIRKARRQDDTR